MRQRLYDCEVCGKSFVETPKNTFDAEHFYCSKRCEKKGKRKEA